MSALSQRCEDGRYITLRRADESVPQSLCRVQVVCRAYKRTDHAGISIRAHRGYRFDPRGFCGPQEAGPLGVH